MPWHSILWHLSHGQQLFSDSCHKGGSWSTRPVYWKLSLSLAKLLHVFCLDSLVVTRTVHFGSATKQYGGGWWQHVYLFAEDKQRSMDRAGWSELLANLCFTVALLLVLELTLTYYVQFELMDTPRRSTSKHNLSQWFGVMPINVVSSSVYYIKCVILRWIYWRIHF